MPDHKKNTRRRHSPVPVGLANLSPETALTPVPVGGSVAVANGERIALVWVNDRSMGLGVKYSVD
jgi:hypothetical protein